MHSLSASSAGTVTLGGDLTVNRIGLGTNRVTGRSEARTVLRRAVELGVNFIDTADIYQSSQSEQTIGETLSPYAPGVIAATKGGMVPGSSPNNSPEYLRRAIEGSLKRLKLECLPLYQLHRVDSRIPIEETVAFLHKMRQEGKIRQIGLSAVKVEQVERALGAGPIASVQNHYNLLERNSEPALSFCERHNIIFIPFFPLREATATRQTIIETLAKRCKASPQQIAIWWLLKRSPVMLPIPGTLSIRHLEENIAAASLELAEDDYRSLDSLSKSPALK